MRGVLFGILLIVMCTFVAAVPQIYMRIYDFPSAIKANGSVDFKVSIENMGDKDAKDISASFGYSSHYKVSDYISVDTLSAGEGRTLVYTLNAFDAAVSEKIDVTVERYFDDKGMRYTPFSPGYSANNPIVLFSIGDESSAQLVESVDNPEWQGSKYPPLPETTTPEETTTTEEEEPVLPFLEDEDRDTGDETTATASIDEGEDVMPGADGATGGQETISDAGSENNEPSVTKEPLTVEDSYRVPSRLVGILIVSGIVAFGVVLFFLLGKRRYGPDTI